MNRKTPWHVAQIQSKRPLKLRRASVDVDLVSGLVEHGLRLLHEGRDEEATSIAIRAVRLRETDASKTFFVQCLKLWSYFPGAEEVWDLLARALLESWAPMDDLLRPATALLNHDPVIESATRRASVAWPQRLPLADLLPEDGLLAVSGNPLLLALLEAGKVVDVKLERVLTSIRAGLLRMTMQGGGNHHKRALRLCCALARQCFTNEYIFDLTPEETDLADKLRNHVSNAIVNRAELPPLALAILSSYHRLDELPESSLLLTRSWPKELADLLDEQIRETAAERLQRHSIPRLTSITDFTSLDVRKQYEENPYPRWTRLPVVASTLTVDESLHREFPFSGYRSIGKTAGLDVLIAGCGTGHNSILFAQSFPSTRILAVDLSLASLSYAKQKSSQMGLNTIEYAQADILELDEATGFDLISCAGVLVTLADPRKGLCKLSSLLRPGGCLHLGLYSEIARRGVVAAQTRLRERGYSTSTEEIRRARREIISAAANEPLMRDVLQFWDFYSMSNCRDLLFPAHENRSSIPQIKDALDENKLEFIGFVISSQLRNRFARRFSRESEADLTLWHQFEIENPDTFRGMYKFWVQKRSSS